MAEKKAQKKKKTTKASGKKDQKFVVTKTPRLELNDSELEGLKAGFSTNNMRVVED